jgi:ferredoxin
MGNIHIENGHPLFLKNCISCGACIQNCPNNAIHHSREKSSARYRNPHIEIGELLIS